VTRFVVTILAACCLALAATGCDNDDRQTQMDAMTMREQPRYDTQTKSNFFADGMAARPRVEHTVAVDDVDAPPPPPRTLALLQRGQQRYAIYCGMCHGTDGYGQGIVAQHGFPTPPTFHSDRLRGLPDEHLYTVITNGLGKMPPYADQIAPADRWAIVSYVRALQRSQHARIDDVPVESREALETTGAAPSGPPVSGVGESSKSHEPPLTTQTPEGANTR